MTPAEATTVFSPALAALWPQVEALSASDRERLSDFLLAYDADEERERIDPVTLAEWNRRTTEMERGVVPGIEADELYRRLRERDE
ncbi:MAG: hypothetical protein ACRCZF_05180 [Gemmataceae bacterium]